MTGTRTLFLLLAATVALASKAQVDCDVTAGVTIALACAGDTNGEVSVTVNSGGPYTYQWDTPGAETTATVGGLGAGIYTVIVTDGANCLSIIPVNLEDPGVIIAGITDYCPSDPPVLTAVPVGGFYPVTWLWSTGDTISVVNIPSGTNGSVDITVTDSLGCQGTAQVTLTELPSPVVAMAATDTACQNAPVLVETIVSTADSVVWNWGGSGFSNELDPLIAFTSSGWQPISLQGFDSLGCGGVAVVDSMFILWQVPAIFSAMQVPCTPMVDIVLGSTADSCAFFIADSLWTHDCAAYFRYDFQRYDSLTFTLYATQANGCSDTLTTTVDVRTEPTLFLSNAFSPNDDGINDLWPVRVDIPDDGFELRLYDRWGHEIWASDDPLAQWDGLLDGDPAPIGVYAYTVRMRDPCFPTNELTNTGHLTVVR